MPTLSDLGYEATATYLIIIGVLGFFANSFVILVLLKAKINFRGIHNKLLLNIAVSDLLISVTAVPLSASSSFAKQTFSKTSTTVARLREEIIVDAQTLKLESMLKYHKILTYRKVTLASLAMVSAFLVAWSPYAVICLYFMLSEARPNSTWPYIVPTMFAKSSIVLSPLSCALFSSSFRKSVKQLFSRSGDDYNDIEDGTELQAIAPLKG
ncbi:unnamed protein product [Mytilus coruscus]|uniref:G-protein coupled receptors family 1 profile domain-containing protein n=1 Tax=Mytilus coruscus TaxID=42192 RepID=A0A6J8D8J5_MYTCO|nr:unnamed protein product [Mytilus coruscus]